MYIEKDSSMLADLGPSDHSDAGQVSLQSFHTTSILVARRDFAILRCRKEENGCIWIPGASMPPEFEAHRPEIARRKRYVRGRLAASGFHLTPVTGASHMSVLTYVVQMDPAGWIPAALANKIAVRQPLNVSVIRSLFEQSH
jgi:hypothetical protein